ncbi:MAG: hypothetical protein KKE23_04395 [Nanoarchaeota archaeon]|nr:hypothetical protein [Nanoarchaeota archaeon]
MIIHKFSSKRGIAILLLASVLLLSLSNIVSAADTESVQVEKAYSYLISQVDGKWTSLSLDSETASLALLALSYDDRIAEDGRIALLAKKHSTNACWPATSCKIKGTALAVLALSRLGEDVEESFDWLNSQQKAFSVSGISWYLQMDSEQPTNCTVTYETTRQVTDNIGINKDRTYSMGSSSCLELSGDKYWLRIKSGCIDKVFSVSCDDASTVSLPYKLGTTLYIQPQTSSVPATISINTLCLKDGSSCTYEGTLWAAYTLMKNGRDYSQLLPYLIGEAASNKKYLPDALLFSLSAKEDHAFALLSQQSRDGYWTDLGGYGRYWDTALASMVMIDYASENITKAKSWLLKNQNPDSSWGTYKIRDTSFILFSIWPKTVSTAIGNCVSSGGECRATSCYIGEVESTLSCLAGGICCLPEGGICTTTSDCFNPECYGEIVSDGVENGVCENPETTCNDNFDNDGNSLVDINDPSCQKFCDDIGGNECFSDESCSGDVRTTLETDRCCLGTCEKATSTCSEQTGNLCSAEKCSGSIIASSDSTATQICCSEKCKSGLSVMTWIMIIILLAALGAGIYYLNKKHYLDKYFGFAKNLFKKKPSSPPPGQQITFRPPVRPFYPPPRTIERRIPTATEKELEETVGKLKGFS